MRTARLAGVISVLALAADDVGCASLITGTAVARKQVSGAGVALADDGNGVVLGTIQDGAPAAVDIFIEPQCPHCGYFVAEYGDAIAKYLATNRLTITIRPLTFLDNGSRRLFGEGDQCHLPGRSGRQGHSRPCVEFHSEALCHAAVDAIPGQRRRDRPGSE